MFISRGKSAGAVLGRFVAAGALVAGGVLLGASAASAAIAPTVITGPVSALTFTSATLSGNVNPNRVVTSWYFQYGTSTSYGLKSSSHSAGSGSGAIGVAVGLTGLTPGTLYHYRLVASSGAGVTVGADAVFTSSLSAPTASNGAPSGLSASTATLHGTVDAHGLATVWYFNYGLGAGYGARTAVQSAGSGTGATDVAIGLTGLVADSNYHYQLVASNAAGTSVSADASFTTSGAPKVATGSLLALSTVTATLSGSVNPAGHATTWYFQYGTSASYSVSTTLHSAGSGSSPVAVSQAISGLLSESTYHYRLVATNGIGTVSSPDATFTTPGPTLTASTTTTIFGHSLTLFGAVPGGAANQLVTVFSQSYKGGSFVSIGTVLTGSGGNWTFSVKPSMDSSYEAIWNGVATPVVPIVVRPAVALRTMAGNRFFTHVVAARSFTGRIAQLQRLVRSHWVTISAQKLSRSSTAVFSPTLSGRSMTLRVGISASQSGAGYAAGYSYRLSYHKR